VSGGARPWAASASSRSRASASPPRKIADAACSWPCPAERPCERRSVELLRAAADDGEHAAVHLDEHGERAAVGEVDELVREVRDAVDVLGPRTARDEHLDASTRTVSQRLEQRVQERPLLSVSGMCRKRASSSWLAPWR
jgi:hypothetical protein